MRAGRALTLHSSFRLQGSFFAPLFSPTMDSPLWLGSCEFSWSSISLPGHRYFHAAAG